MWKANLYNMTSNKTLKHYSFSSLQPDIWFDQILYPDVPLYNVGGYLRIDGSIVPTVFEQALNQVIKDNDALRIILHQEKTLSVLEIVKNVHIHFDCHDFSEQENAPKLAQAWMAQAFIKPFQLYDNN